MMTQPPCGRAHTGGFGQTSAAQLFEDEFGLDAEHIASGLQASRKRKKVSLILAAVGAACVVIGCVVAIAVVLSTNGMNDLCL
jgi:hypothetical protein